MVIDLLNSKITIKKIENNIVNGRREESKETTFYSCRADVLDLYGKELYEAINLKLENTIIFKIRYCKLIEALRKKEDYIVEWNGRKYSIYYVDFMAYKRKYIKIKCNEVL